MGLFSSHLSKPIVSWLNQEKAPLKVPLSDFDKITEKIQPCDVILVEGRTRISDVIRIVTQSAWTHAAFYIGRLSEIEDPKFRAKATEYFQGDPDTQLVIESLLGAGTVLRPLTNYRNDHLRICRPKGLFHQDSQQAINFTLSRLGLEYDFRQILDLARFLFPWALWPRRWRSTLFAHNAGRPTKTVCSTMIAEAFNAIQFPILPLVRQSKDNKLQLFRRNPKMCVPRDFDYSPYFEIIKYPFVDYYNYGDYRLLPWHGSGALAEDGSTASGRRKPISTKQERWDEQQMLEQESRNRLENDPLVEEIAGADSPLAQFPSRDVPVEEQQPASGKTPEE